VVALVVVTVTLVVVEVLDPDEAEGRTEATVKPLPLTAVTLPTAPNENPPPEGRFVGTPDGAPEGRPAPPRKPPPPKPPEPWLQSPLADRIRTVAAATAELDELVEPEPDAVRAGLAITQAPTCTAEALAETSWVKAVLLVQVTAVWLVWLCTWAVDPETAATFPLAPGKPRPPAVPLWPDCPDPPCCPT